MSTRWLNYMFNETDLSGSELLLAVAIADTARDDGTAWPGIVTLGRKIRLCERQVQKLIKRLEARGFLIIERKVGRGNFAGFQLQKVNPMTPFPDQKRRTLGHKKGELQDIKKVNFRTLPIYKEEPLLEPLKNHRQRRRKKPPVAAPAAIEAIRSVCDRYPPKSVWATLQKLVGDQPDVERLRECFEKWILRGFKPINYSWAWDWYVNGIPESRANGKGSGADIDSPDYKQGKRPFTFDDAIDAQRAKKNDRPDLWSDRATYNEVVEHYGRKHPDQVATYEQSIEFRQRFGEA